jgi:hypothetical protein
MTQDLSRQQWNGQMRKRYTVTDHKIVLTVEEAREGGFVVTSPLDAGLVTQAETLPEAFENARDALKALRISRAKLFKRRKNNHCV